MRSVKLATLVWCRKHLLGLSNWTAVARVLLTIATVWVLALTLAGSAQAKIQSEFFQMPSGNIGCLYSPPAYLRCDIRGGLKPKPSVPPRPTSCDLEWGDSVALSSTGPTTLVCHGDTALPGPGTKVLRYGTTWTRGPFTCTSRTTGLTCTNKAGHGFLLNLQSWRRF